MIRTTFLCGLLAGCATTASVTFYPLDELKALDSPENKAELLEHALEVAPSKRDDAWRGLVERAAVATLAAVEVKNVPSAEQALGLVEQLPTKFVFLKGSPVWLQKRADVAVVAFPWVNENARSNDWVRRMLEFAKADAKTPRLAQRLAEEVVVKRLIPSTALPFYELALERDGAAACSSAGLPASVLGSVEYGDSAKDVIKTCWKQLEAPLINAIKTAETRTLKLKICALMTDPASSKALCTFDN